MKSNISPVLVMLFLLPSSPSYAVKAFCLRTVINESIEKHSLLAQTQFDSIAMLMDHSEFRVVCRTQQ